MVQGKANTRSARGTAGSFEGLRFSSLGYSPWAGTGTQNWASTWPLVTTRKANTGAAQPSLLPGMESGAVRHSVPLCRAGVGQTIITLCAYEVYFYVLLFLFLSWEVRIRYK